MRNEYGAISTVPEKDTYNKAEVDELVADINGAMRTTYDYHSKRLDDVYYPLNDSIDRLTTRMDGLKEEMDMIRMQNAVGPEASIDGYTRPSLDDRHKPL